jgi:LPS sulfotransferase NodH
MEFMICTTARSGSNLFCNILTNTKILGRPVEAFNPDIVRASRFATLPDQPGTVSAERYIAWLLANQRSSNGIFGTKVLFEDFEAFRGFGSFGKLFLESNLVHLRRRSKLRQAISYYFAEQTNQWVASDVAKKQISEVPFDFAAIDRHLRRLVLQDATWSSYLQGLNRPYLEVYFEDFLADMRKVLETLASQLGIEARDFAIHASLEEQRNARTQEFVRAYQQQLPDVLFSARTSVDYKNMRFVP